MQKSLEQILQDQQAYADKDQQRFRDAFLKSYLRRGLDRTLVLYRLENSGFAVAAHAKLGWFDYRTGRYEPASILHSLFALDHRRHGGHDGAAPGRSRTYEFESLARLPARGRAAGKRSASYLAESGFFRIAYYLAASTWAAATPPGPGKSGGCWRTEAGPGNRGHLRRAVPPAAGQAPRPSRSSIPRHGALE